MLKFINTAALVLIIGFGAGPATAQTSRGGPAANEGAEGSATLAPGPRGLTRKKRMKQETDCGHVEALATAARMGISGGVIADSRYSSIKIAGSNAGNLVSVRFARSPGCPVIRSGL